MQLALRRRLHPLLPLCRKTCGPLHGCGGAVNHHGGHALTCFRTGLLARRAIHSLNHQCPHRLKHIERAEKSDGEKEYNKKSREPFTGLSTCLGAQDFVGTGRRGYLRCAHLPTTWPISKPCIVDWGQRGAPDRAAMPCGRGCAGALCPVQCRWQGCTRPCRLRIFFMETTGAGAGRCPWPRHALWHTRI